MRPIDKVELSTNLMLKVFNGGMDVAEEVLMELMDKMNIHGMTIYKAPSMECRKTLGHYEKSREHSFVCRKRSILHVLMSIIFT